MYRVSTGSRKHRAESADRLAYAALRWVTWAVMAIGAPKENTGHTNADPQHFNKTSGKYYSICKLWLAVPLRVCFNMY